MEHPHLPQGQVSLGKKFKLHPVLLSVLLLLILTSLGLSVYFLTTTKKFEPPSKAATSGQKEPTVTLKSDFKNPFQQQSQYLNPFDPTKSPLYNLKK